jgi:hypothetical protein
MIRCAGLGLIAGLLVACTGTIGGVSGDDTYDGQVPSGPGSPRNDPGFATSLPPSGALPEGSIDGPPEEVINVPPEQFLEIAPEDLANVPPEALIKASRTTCTSPCAVFFDTISDQSWAGIETSTFIWAFSDGATSDGFMVAHVFELPEGSAEETFEVILVAARDGVAVAQDTHQVTVRPPQGRTICVAESDFSGCPSSNRADHFADVPTAWREIQPDGRILFRRGDSFSSGFQFTSTASGPVQVGAFGDAGAPRPMLTQAGGSWKLGSEWSLTDLDISGSAIDDALIAISGDHTLVMRSHLRDTMGAFVSDGEGYDFSTHKFIVNNAVTGMSKTNYLAGDYIAVVGNRMERWGANRHTIRIGGGKHVLVAGNELISDVGHTSLTVRGAGTRRPGSDYVLVQDNLLMQWATVMPQNKESNEWLRHVIWERNVHVPHESETSIQNGLSLNGDDMVIRNNIFHQIRRAISISDHPLTGSSDNIHVYQNTHFVDRDNSSAQWFFAAGSGHTGLVVENNLAALFSNEAGTEFISIGGPGGVLNTNFGYTPGRTGSCERPDGSSTCTDPRLENTIDRESASFMRPQADSLAVDAATNVPVFSDIHGTPRPQGDAPDVGAVERVAPQ